MLHKQKRKTRRERLIEVGLDLFSRYSYDEVAIDDIAAAANISKGLLYYYFPTKHDFYLAVLRHSTNQLLELTEPDASLEPLERLRVGLLAYFTFAELHARTYVALLRGGVGVDPEVAAILNHVRQTYVERVLQGLPESERHGPALRLAITGWVGFVEALSLSWLEERQLSKEQLTELAIRTLLATINSLHELGSSPR
ncbi:TetR/AcrR family transcriptional regulator [Thermogemmatispora sp.]|uniref:TetR/AcrR family transcriptional regulator n=1 Tax=Thermogemmatispora sp. TaxID=1968838 RepID=UPI001D9FE573|nr:TetR/AcrR family transcriptional regulator [Thermogemmatispora sp.]MBX5451065.1 TetR/AcrR family transcriptional regulator [Thermogemmatispora sp.]